MTAVLSHGAQGVHLSAQQGATWRLAVAWTTGIPATAVNITGWSARMQVRHTCADDDLIGPLIDISDGNGLTVDGPAGTVTAVIDPVTTAGISDGEYVWEMTVGGGGATDRVSLATGILSVTPQIEREVAP